MKSQRTKLWYFIGALVVGGAERTLVDLSNEIDHDTYDVTIWTIFDTNPLESELNSNVSVRSLTNSGRIENDRIAGVDNRLVYLLAPLRFWYTARRGDPDIIQSFLFYDNVIARLAGPFCGATIITGVREVPNEEPLFRRVVDSITISLSDFVVSNSTDGADYAVERGAADESVDVIYNGRDIHKYQDSDPIDIHEEEAIPDGATIIATVGRLVERKGHFDLLDSWETIRTNIPDAHLLFIGDGQDRDALEARANELESSESVHFLGTRNDVPALLATTDIFVFPSHYEGLPGAVIEAMAAGLPIVATPVDGNQDLLKNYQSGLFVQVESPQEVAWATIRLYQQPSFAQSLGESAATRAATEFTIDSMVTEFESLYQEIDNK